VIPLDVAAKIPAAVDLLVRKEKEILDAARDPSFNMAKLREAIRASDEIH
jgi:hypothetical protein